MESTAILFKKLSNELPWLDTGTCTMCYSRQNSIFTSHQRIIALKSLIPLELLLFICSFIIFFNCFLSWPLTHTHWNFQWPIGWVWIFSVTSYFCTITCSITCYRVLLICQNITVGKCWKLFPATASKNFILCSSSSGKVLFNVLWNAFVELRNKERGYDFNINVVSDILQWKFEILIWIKTNECYLHFP